jgi:GNAT superfamily N-acetyltransferase
VILFVAMSEGSAVGSAQLVPSRLGNSPHRAEIEKVFVAREVRGRGVGTTLMKAIEQLALHYRRRLLLLNARVGEHAHTWYRRLGYREVGVVPGWAVGPDGERYDYVEMYKELAG